MCELCGRLGLCALFSHAEKTHSKRQDESSAARSSSPKQATSLSANERRHWFPAHVVSSYSEAAVPQAIFCHPLFTLFSHSPISFSFFLLQASNCSPCEWDIDPSPNVPFLFQCGCTPREIQPVPFPVKNTEKEAACRANSCRRGRISHLEMGRTDRGIMKLLTSKQAAESWADGRPMARAPPDWATRHRTDQRPRGSYGKKRTKKKGKVASRGSACAVCWLACSQFTCEI